MNWRSRGNCRKEKLLINFQYISKDKALPCFIEALPYCNSSARIMPLASDSTEKKTGISYGLKLNIDGLFNFYGICLLDYLPGNH
jgi:hypothetical protein